MQRLNMIVKCLRVYKVPVNDPGELEMLGYSSECSLQPPPRRHSAYMHPQPEKRKEGTQNNKGGKGE